MDPSAEASPILSPIQRGAEVVAELNTLIETRLSRSDGVRHRGFLRQKRLIKICNALKDARFGLLTALSAINHLQMVNNHQMYLNIQSISLVRSSTPDAPVPIGPTQASGVQGDIADLGQLAVKDQHDTSRDYRYLLEQLDSTQNTTSPATQDLILQNTIQQPSFKRPLDQSLEKLTIAAEESHQPLYLCIRASDASEKCPPLCGCQCHTRYHGSSPRWLQTVFGSLFYQYTGKPLLGQRSCNYVHCRQRGGSVRFEYTFPAWLVSWIIRATGTWNDLEGIGGSWTLMMPMYMPTHVSNFLQEVIINADSAVTLQKYLDIHKIPARSLDWKTGFYLFDYALASRKLDMIKLLIYRGIDWHFRGEDNRTIAQTIWILVLVCSNDDELAWKIKDLVEQEESIDTLELNPLHKTVLGLVKIDLKEQTKLNPEFINGKDCFGMTPLSYAVSQCDLYSTSVLIDSGADVNARGSNGRPPLHLTDNIDCIKLLIDAGADVNALIPSADHFISRISTAAFYGQTELVSFLLEHGADPYIGQSALISAATSGHLEVVKMLVNWGVDVNRRVSSKLTALQIATYYRRGPCLPFLLMNGARADAVDGITILDVAAVRGNVVVMDILTKAQIEGLQVTLEDRARYWGMFPSARNQYRFVDRDPIEEERAAFQRLLDSIQPVEGSLQLAIEDQASDDEFLDAVETLQA